MKAIDIFQTVMENRRQLTKEEKITIIDAMISATMAISAVDCNNPQFDTIDSVYELLMQARDKMREALQ